VKTSAIRRWLREERARENVEALAAGVNIAPTGGPAVGVDPDAVMARARALLQRVLEVPMLTEDEARARALAWAANEFPGCSATFNGKILRVTPPAYAEHINMTIGFNDLPEPKI
jgi:hypothetical protein